MRGGWLYIVANRPVGTLHVDATNNLPRRAREHRTGVGSGFTKRYRLGMLDTQNPDWLDLYDTLLA